MQGHLVTFPGSVTDTPTELDRSAIEQAIASGQHFWLDLLGVDADVISVLGADFGFHPLAVEDAEHFGQRPKVDVYDDYVVVVAYGIGGDGTPVEVHCFVGTRFLVTVHRDPVPSLVGSVELVQRHRTDLPQPVMMLHRVLDGLVDGYFPVLATIDEAIDALQDDILHQPSDRQLGDLFVIKRRLILLRRYASEQRDMLASVLAGTQPLPGMTDEAERYFRDLYDHLERLTQSADGYRDLLSSALDTHLSTTSNRLNVVMKQLAIIATVFLPMSFLTGFFGQNFGWMVDHLGGSAVFWIAGVALQVVVAGALLMMFRRMGWLGERTGDQR